MTNFSAPSNPLRQRSDESTTDANVRYRGLACQLLADAAKSSCGYAVGIASSSRGEGVTNTIANLAVAAAPLADSTILLVDLASDGYSLADYLNVNGNADAADVLDRRLPLTDAVQPTSFANLDFLRGDITSPQHDVKAWETLLDEAKRTFGLVLLDLPPIAELSSQTASLGSLDGLFLVVEAGRTRQKAALRTKSLLQRMGIQPLGIVLNKRKTFVPNWLYNKV